MKETLTIAMYSDYITELNGGFKNAIDIARILYLAKAYAFSIGLDDAFDDITFTNKHNRYDMTHSDLARNLDANGLRDQIVHRYCGSVKYFIKDNNRWEAFDIKITDDEKQCIKFVMLEIPAKLIPYLIYGGVISNDAYLPVMSNDINTDDMKKYYHEGYFNYVISNMSQIKRGLGL